MDVGVLLGDAVGEAAHTGRGVLGGQTLDDGDIGFGAVHDLGHVIGDLCAALTLVIGDIAVDLAVGQLVLNVEHDDGDPGLVGLLDSGDDGVGVDGTDDDAVNAAGDHVLNQLDLRSIVALGVGCGDEQLIAQSLCLRLRAVDAGCIVRRDHGRGKECDGFLFSGFRVSLRVVRGRRGGVCLGGACTRGHKEDHAQRKHQCENLFHLFFLLILLNVQPLAAHYGVFSPRGVFILARQNPSKLVKCVLKLGNSFLSRTKSSANFVYIAQILTLLYWIRQRVVPVVSSSSNCCSSSSGALMYELIVSPPRWFVSVILSSVSSL